MHKNLEKLFKKIGPGIVTGASDDDPSGIATYSLAGAAHGYSLLWTAFLTFPLMASIQEMCARIGLVTERGLTANIKKHYKSKILLYAISFIVVITTSFNIGADEITSVNALARIIAEKFGGTPTMVHLKERHEVKHAHADHAKIKQLLEYKTATPLDVGIERTIAWTKVAGMRRTKEFSNIEIRKNLPEGWN